MTQNSQPEAPIDEIHRIRREISERFDGDVAAIAADAARRARESGRLMWRPKPAGQLPQPAGGSNTSSGS